MMFATRGGLRAQKIDVIVAGAGPVGFLAALGLARAGLTVRILEAEAAISEQPRAALYFPTARRRRRARLQSLRRHGPHHPASAPSATLLAEQLFGAPMPV